MGLAHFSIGTATDRIDLLRNVRIANWEPSETPIEDTFASSALAEGRQLASHRYLNAIENMTLHVIAPTQDRVIEWSQDLRRMLRRAREYWDTEYQPDIVYLQARASCETYYRYAWVHSGAVPEDSDPYAPPFAGRGAPRFWERQLIVERSAWMADSPGTGTVVAVEGSQEICFPPYLIFDGATQDVDCGSDAKLDDLPVTFITVDAWVRIPVGTTGTHAIMGKTVGAGADGWVVYWNDVLGLCGLVACLTVNAYSESAPTDLTADGLWHHVLFCYDDAGAVCPAAKTVYLEVDGVWVAAYTTQTQGIGAYQADAARVLYIGSTNTFSFFWLGDIGWARVSDAIIHDPTGPATFTPPVQCQLPDISADTQGQWIKEGAGTAIENQAGGAGATASFSTWDCDCDTVFGEA